MTVERKAVDWETVEREYRAGQLSVRVIAGAAGITEGAIRKKAKANGWKRDLTEKVRRAVRTELVRSEVRAKSGPPPTEREIVEDATQRAVSVVREHRKDIGAGRKIVGALFDELSATIDEIAEIEDDIKQETAGDQNSSRRTTMLRAVSLPSRASVVVSLSTALKNLVGLEREAFNLDSQPDDPSRRTIAEYSDEELSAIAGAAGGAGAGGGPEGTPEA